MIAVKKNIYLVAKKPLEGKPWKLKIYIPYFKDSIHFNKYKRHINGEKCNLVDIELQNTESYLWKNEQVHNELYYLEKIFLLIFIQHTS